MTAFAGGQNWKACIFFPIRWMATKSFSSAGRCAAPGVMARLVAHHMLISCIKSCWTGSLDQFGLRCISFSSMVKMCIRVSIPGRVFYSREYGNGISYSRDSQALGNDVYYEGLIKEKNLLTMCCTQVLLLIFVNL